MNSLRPKVSAKSIPQDDPGFDITLYFGLVKRHWLAFFITVGSVFSLSAIYALTIVPIYEARGLIMLQSQNTAGALAGIPAIGGLAGSSQNQINTQIEIFKTDPVLEGAANSLNLRNREGQPINPRSLLSDTSISAIPRTDIFQVSFRSPDPEEAVRVADGLMNSFIENDIRISRVQKTAAREFIDSQLPLAENDLNRSLESLQEFSEKHNILAVEPQVTAIVNELSLLRQGISEKQVELAGLQDTERQLASILGVSTIEANDLALLAESIGVQTAIENLQITESELAELRSKYQDNHPKVQALLREQELEQGVLNQRISELVDINQLSVNQSPANLQRGPSNIDLLVQQVTNIIQVRNTEQQLQGLQERYNEQLSFSNRLPELQKTYLLKELAVETSKLRYTKLLEAAQVAQLAENQDVGGAVIIQDAVPVGIVSVPPLRIVVLGALLGTVMGVAVAYLLDQIDKTIYTEDEVKAIYPFSTVLATIPQLNSAENGIAFANNNMIERHTTLVVRDDPRLPASEAYRMLLANVKFSNSDGQLKVITITSAMPGEGKSTTVANLGLAMAELGLRAIILDSDMRRPSQHDVWQIPNRVGLSNYLVESISFEDCIFAENDFLDVVTAGVIPPNPVALLNSEKYATLLKKLRETYDYVLIDAPPLTVAADALMLGKNSNAILLVARPGKLIRPAALKAKDSIQQSGQNILGLVVNGIKQTRKDDMYYYYSPSEESRSASKNPFINLIKK